jgi:rubrerythrin
MTMRRSLAELSPQEILWVALRIEERNARIYENYAEMFEWYEPDVARTFREMAREEREHGRRLGVMYAERYEDAVCDLTEEEIREIVEAPVFEDGEAFIYDRARRRHAFEVGREAERRARAFYAEMAERATDAAVRALFRELAEIESEHEALLAQKLAEDSARDREERGEP